MTRTLLTALILLPLTLTACGEVTGHGCIIDSDCSAGEMCIQDTEECVPAPAGSCANTAECAEGERCEGATASERGMCVEPEPSCADQAEPDAYCVAKTPDTVCEPTTGLCIRDPNKPVCATKADCGADELCAVVANIALCIPNDCSNQLATFCGSVERGTVCDPTTKRCVPDTAPRHIMIQDMSSGTSSCESRTADGLYDAGSDITFIELTDAEGTAIGYGKAVTYEQGSGQVDTRFINVFSGEQSALDGQGCPLDGFTTETVVSLGCGGALFVEFVGADSRAVELMSGLRVLVGEYGPYCAMPGGSLGTDRYTVYLCAAPAQGASPTSADCTQQLGAQTTGPGGFDIP